MEDKNTQSDGKNPMKSLGGENVRDIDSDFEDEASNEKPAEGDASGFDDMLENYLDRMKTHKKGEVIPATVVDVKREYVLLDIGEKAEGVVAVDEFRDAKGNICISFLVAYYGVHCAFRSIFSWQ